MTVGPIGYSSYNCDNRSRKNMSKPMINIIILSILPYNSIIIYFY